MTSLEEGISDAVSRRVFCGKFNGSRADLDSSNFFEGGGAAQREQSAAAIGIDEEFCPAAGSLRADITGKCR